MAATQVSHAFFSHHHYDHIGDYPRLLLTRWDQGSFVYSGDTGPCRALQALAQDCDVLVHMCHYLTGTAPSKVFAAFTMGHRELAELAQSANVRNLVLSHVTSQFDRPGMRERVLRQIGEVFKGNVFFGEDLMEIPFTSPAAVKLD